MATNGLTDFINRLENAGELDRISSFVDPVLEIAEITDRISKLPGGGKAILFENTGTEFPLLINALGSERRLAMAFGRNSIEEIEEEILSLFSAVTSPKNNLWEKLKLLPRLKEVASWMPHKLNEKGKCQEVVMNYPDLGRLPILHCWPADGGRFITLPAVHTTDPETGAPNVGMYRMQVFEKNMTGMHWHRHKTGANHFSKYKALGRKMPVTVTLGGDPSYIYAATAPMPENMDEYLLAGFLRKKRVSLVKCLTNNLYVPNDVDFVIEGFVDPAEELIWEGPFGDHTGFYSLPDFYPRFHITCITHRKDAVYPATIVGIPPMEDAWIGKATERIFTSPIRLTMIPELLDMDLPFAGVAHNLAVVKIKKSYPGQAIKVMNALWGAGQMMFNKFLVVVDESVDIHAYDDLVKLAFERLRPVTGLHFMRGPLDVLDHSSDFFAFGSKAGIDLTTPWPEERSTDSILINCDELSRIPSPALNNVAGIVSSRDLSGSGLPILLISVAKLGLFSRDSQFSALANLPGIEKYRLVALFDERVDLEDLFSMVWLMGGNIDPVRDIKVLTSASGHPVIFADSTMKSGEHDQFGRDWPNVVVSSDDTIAAIDRKWTQLGLGDFIPSPSIKYKPLISNTEAVKSQGRIN